MKRPPNLAGAMATMPLVRVLLEPVRSAEPPIVSGHAALITSSAFSEALRVATDGFSALVFFLRSLSAPASPVGALPASAASNVRAISAGCFALRASHASRAGFPRPPTSRQSDRMSLGTTKGGQGQSSALRAPATSSAPSASPWAFAVPARVGAPKPMVVRAAIRTGLSLVCAASRHRATSAASCPSQAQLFQPAASNRLRISPVPESAVGPSMVIWLSSNSTISLLSFRWPASPIASWLMPSIRSPSPAIT